MNDNSFHRIFASVIFLFVIVFGFAIIGLMMCSCDGGYEANKRVNFDVCKAQCADAGTSLETFEQGLGYVKCSCIKKDEQ